MDLNVQSDWYGPLGFVRVLPFNALVRNYTQHLQIEGGARRWSDSREAADRT